jgi:ABC-type nickel/cobalt efflux system permease component RcnA
MQSVTAIAIVAIAAVLLGATAKLMGETLRVIEIVSYGLIVLLGARLLWVKGHGLLRAWRALKAPPAKPDLCAHAGGHAHASACGHDDHVHHEEPDVLWRGPLFVADSQLTAWMFGNYPSASCLVLYCNTSIRHRAGARDGIGDGLGCSP